MVTAGILPFRENSHGRTGNRTRVPMISRQRLWPLDHEAGLVARKVRVRFPKETDAFSFFAASKLALTIIKDLSYSYRGTSTRQNSRTVSVNTRYIQFVALLLHFPTCKSTLGATQNEGLHLYRPIDTQDRMLQLAVGFFHIISDSSL